MRLPRLLTGDRPAAAGTPEASARRGRAHRAASAAVARRTDANRRAERTGTASRKRGWW